MDDEEIDKLPASDDPVDGDLLMKTADECRVDESSGVSVVDIHERAADKIAVVNNTSGHHNRPDTSVWLSDRFISYLKLPTLSASSLSSFLHCGDNSLSSSVCFESPAWTVP